jgi:hypothetical protein
MKTKKIDNLDNEKRQMLNALERSLGVVTSACKAVGISRQTHYNWLNDDLEYKAAVHSIDDIAIDFAESQLHQQIKNGEVSSTIFFLKTKGKKRGYVERQEITGAEGNPFQIIIPKEV